MVILLLNLVEELKQENQAVRLEIQRMRDENNRLKGEQGKPNAKSVAREENVAVPASELPADATFKGYEAVLVQDLFMTVAETSKKLGVTFYQYVRDCLSYQ